MNFVSEFDILIVGAGAAGLRAAIEIAESSPDTKIALISKVYPTRSHSVAAEGGVASVILAEDSFEKHIQDTIIGSDYIADQDAVEFFVQKCQNEIYQLDQWGCPWSRTEDGKIAVRAFGGMNEKRTVYAADKTGLHILHTLFERSLLHENIKRFDEFFAVKLITEENQVRGLLTIDQKNGEFVLFSSATIIFATGGAGQLFRNTTNSAINTGDGAALALKEGATLKDMEFIQFHPTCLPGSGILISEAARGEGGYLINNKNERFLKDYIQYKMELGPRDVISRAMVSEYEKGHGFHGPFGPYMHLDLKHLGKKIIEEKLPQIRDLVMTYLSIDPVKSDIPVTTAQHYFMGGIHVNLKGESTISGLFAVGETACISINGANRLGSNSLAKCLVFGKETGKNALEHSALKHKKKTGQPGNMTIKAEAEIKKILSLLNKGGQKNPYEIYKEMKITMEENAGIVRHHKNLQTGLETIKSLKKQLNETRIKQKNLIFNNELITILETGNMLDLAEVIFESALSRKESRGAHFRTDYPDKNNADLFHSMATNKDGHLHVEKLPVKITKWKPL